MHAGLYKYVHAHVSMHMYVHTNYSDGQCHWNMSAHMSARVHTSSQHQSIETTSQHELLWSECVRATFLKNNSLVWMSNTTLLGNIPAASNGK